MATPAGEPDGGLAKGAFAGQVLRKHPKLDSVDPGAKFDHTAVVRLHQGLGYAGQRCVEPPDPGTRIQIQSHRQGRHHRVV